jgi:outer membrane protein OmpA-like peptidoglycan-associated protein
LAAALVTAVLVTATVMVIRAHATGCSPSQGTIIWADQVTAEEGDDPRPPAGLVAQSDALAACGAGRLLLVRAAGAGGVQAAPPLSLRIYREPGQLEHDPTARLAAVHRLIGRGFHDARTTPVPGDGRDVIGLLAAISADLGPGQTDIWLRTLGLPTVAPADARLLMAADPTQAVASLARWVPSLRGARVHLILSPPAGDQPRFNTVTDGWRRAFMSALLRRAGADLVSIQEVQAMEKPAPGAPAAPVVPNLPEFTPQPPAPQPGNSHQIKITLDSSAFFLPNSAHFAGSDNRVVSSLQPIIRAWRSGGYARVAVVGHCARFGPPGGAVQLSRRRAEVVAALLRRAGIKPVTATGVGYRQPLPPDPLSATNRVVVVTAYPKT